MVKAVIFDFDGTLADTYWLLLDIGKDIAAREGVEICEDMDFQRMSATEIVDYLGVSKLKIPFYVKELRDKIEERIDEVKPFDGMKEVVEELSEKYMLGVLSGNKEETIREFLKNNDLDKHFEAIVGGIKLFGKKGKISKMVKELGVEKEQAIYIADGEKDIEACKNDEITIISVPWGYNSQDILEEKDPEFMAETPEEILKIIDSISQG